MRVYLLAFVILMMTNGEVLLGQNLTSKDVIPDNGVYHSLQDFNLHRLSYSFQNKKEGYQLKLPRLNTIEIKMPNLTTRIYLRNVWGFRQNGHDWVFRNGELFELLNYEGLWIYQKSVLDDSGNHDLYYFSKSPESEIIWLNRKNIKEVFAKDTAFVNALELLKWSQSIDTVIPPNNKLRIVELYKISHSNNTQY
ncbi:hypothetical protein VB264_17150 [Arcicella aquatica]|uniref:Uncharacterized protein n=1 Tax=Arcicella aquatica TaxID=217141 RepID=A0ABU5QR35_9BACT|nr:hypothetical protein [Arcicella aquatica]MEA5259528.1 hypothetical protein [Arcicella aquatica]